MLFLTNPIDQFLVLGSCSSYTNYMLAGVIIIFLLLSVRPLIHLSIAGVGLVRNTLIGLLQVGGNVAKFACNHKMLGRGLFICGLLISYLNLNLRALMNEVTGFQGNSFDIVIAKAGIGMMVAVGVLILGLFYANLKISDSIVARCSNNMGYVIEIIHLICVVGITLCSAYIIFRTSALLDYSISDSITLYLSTQFILFFSRTVFLKYVLNARNCFYPIFKILGISNSPTGVEFDKVADEIASSISAKTGKVRVIVFLVITVGMGMLSVAIKPWSLILIASLTDFFAAFAVYVNGGDFTMGMFKRAPREVSRMSLFRGFSQQKGGTLESETSTVQTAKKVEEELIHKANVETFKPLIEKLTSTTLLSKVTLKEEGCVINSKNTIKELEKRFMVEGVEDQLKLNTEKETEYLVKNSVLHEIKLVEKHLEGKIDGLSQPFSEDSLKLREELVKQREEFAKLRVEILARTERGLDSIKRLEDDMNGLKKKYKLGIIGGALGITATTFYLGEERERVLPALGKEMPGETLKAVKRVSEIVGESVVRGYEHSGGVRDDFSVKLIRDGVAQVGGSQKRVECSVENKVTVSNVGNLEKDLIKKPGEILSKPLSKISDAIKSSIGIPVACSSLLDNAGNVLHDSESCYWIIAQCGKICIHIIISVFLYKYIDDLMPCKEARHYLLRAGVVLSLILLQWSFVASIRQFMWAGYVIFTETYNGTVGRPFDYMIYMFGYMPPLLILFIFFQDLLIVSITKIKRNCGHSRFIQILFFKNTSIIYRKLTYKQLLELWAQLVNAEVETVDVNVFNNLQKDIGWDTVYVIPNKKTKTYTIIIEPRLLREVDNKAAKRSEKLLGLF